MPIDEVQYLREGIAEREAEIERLRAAFDEQNFGRLAVIEECARVAESYRNVQLEWIKADAPERIAAAIRVLKDKP